MSTVKKRSQKQEKSVAKNFNARVTVASGALWGMKADCRSDKCLIECKTTEKDYYPVTAKVWEKVESEALDDGMRIPLLIVDIEDKDRLVVFDPKYFETGGLVNGCECSYEKTEEGNKSFRISLKYLLETEEFIEEYCYGKIFQICGKKNHLLCYMRVKDFEERVKEEIF